MRICTVPFLSVLALLSMCAPKPGFGQQHAPSARMIPAVSVFISGDYFAPDFQNVDAVYSSIQKNYNLPSGRAFKDYYTIMGGIIISPVEQQSVQLEAGGSLYKSQLGNSLGQTGSINFLQMYYFGGTYSVNFPIKPVSLFIGAGPGYICLNTERTYSVQPGTARVAADLFQVHATGGIEYFHPTGVSIALEGGYAYATTPFPQRADLDFTLKGFTAGVRVTVPLVNSF